MFMLKPALISLLLLLSGSVDAATFEKPVFAKFKGTPLDENPVMGYVQFGQLRDGSPAIQKVNSSTVRVYQRDEFGRINVDEDSYTVSEINCKSGAWQIIAMGFLTRITAMKDPPKPVKVGELHPKNVLVYREACNSMGIETPW